MKKDSLWKLIALSGVPLIMVLGNSMLIPVLPDMQKAMDITKMQAGLTITLFSLPAGLAIPVMGFLADKYGRKPIIVPALIIYAIGGIVSGLAAWWWHSYPLLLTGRVIQGLGASGTGPIAMALVGDIFTSSERTKALGGLEAANGLGKVISPILGAAIALIIWYALFFVYAIFAVPIAIFVWLIIKEPAPKKQNQSAGAYIGKLKDIFKDKGKSLVGCYFAGSVVLLVLFGILSYLSDVLETAYGLDGIIKGFALAVPVLAMSSTSFFGGKFLEKQLGRLKYFIILGLILVGGSMAAIGLINRDLAFFTGVVIMGIGTGLVLPAVNTLVTSSVQLEERGGITALYGGVRFIGVAIGPPAFDFLLGFNRTAMFLGGAGLAALGLILAVWLINEQQLLQGLQKGQQQTQKAPKLSPEPT
ncbi:MAG: MFS transporter [Clostridia bacterium]|jgi:ACDE family multidrug resistance protein|nr:MFS transporter [Clostridia bacterium]